MRTNKDAASLPKSCGACGRPGHRAGSEECAREPWAIDMVGVEIEGLWEDLRDAKLRASARNASGTPDGSLEEMDDEDADGAAYEFRTAPGSVGEAIRALADLYPDFTNRTCGMHVHLSFRDKASIGLLNSPEFFEFFYGAWKEWGKERKIPEKHEFWRRLRGENTYCAVNEDTMDWHGDRYMALNFSAWHKHRTMECRLLPMFRDSAMGCAAVVRLCEIVDEYLSDAVETHLGVLGSRVRLPLSAGFMQSVSYPLVTESPGVTLPDFVLDLNEVPEVTPGYRRVARAHVLANPARYL